YGALFHCRHPATPEIYPRSLHDALPIYRRIIGEAGRGAAAAGVAGAFHLQGGVVDAEARLQRLRGLVDEGVVVARPRTHEVDGRSEEHTSELQSRENLVCRLLLEKKKKT